MADPQRPHHQLPPLADHTNCRDVGKLPNLCITHTALATGHSSEGDGIAVETAWAMLDCEVKFLKYLEPPTLLADWFRCSAQPLQGDMVGTYEELGTQEVLAELTKEMDNGKQFLYCHTVTPFGLGIQSTGIDYDTFFPVLYLRQYGPNAVV